MTGPATPAPSARPRAVLAAVQLPDTDDHEVTASLDELQRLVETLGLETVARVTQKRKSIGSAAVFGAGKLQEIARLTGGSGVVAPGVSRRPGKKTVHPWQVTDAEDGSEPDDIDAEPDEESAAAAGVEWSDDAALDREGEAPRDAAEAAGATDSGARRRRASVLVVDADLTPSQLRNLESATSAEVLDRSSVILNIFQRHARTREAVLQVEIARLTYLAPRLRASGSGDRQRGGIGGKGAGESAAELDRRRVRDRIAAMRRELDVVLRDESARRKRRSAEWRVAIVGYTNAGKSSLMRALTGSDVLVADKLFATLDTTIRTLHPPLSPKVLVSDTVGFIRRLPHGLVASFRSTLEEAKDASLLLHVVDASDPSFRSQIDVTRDVLREVGAGDRPSLLVLNKLDRLDAAAAARLADEFPGALLISARSQADVARVHAAIAAWFERDMVDGELFVPYADQQRVHAIHQACRVLAEAHDEEGTRLRVRAPPEVLEELKSADRAR